MQTNNPWILRYWRRQGYVITSANEWNTGRQQPMLASYGFTVMNELETWDGKDVKVFLHHRSLPVVEDGESVPPIQIRIDRDGKLSMRM